MRVFQRCLGFFPFVLLAVCVVAVPGRCLADGNGADDKRAEAGSEKSGGDAATRATARKMEAPEPLSARERWLLDRVEELEKRVADLEAKGQVAAAGSGAAAGAASGGAADASGSTLAATPGVASSGVATTAANMVGAAPAPAAVGVAAPANTVAAVEPGSATTASTVAPGNGNDG
jgi:hypothetical protein